MFPLLRRPTATLVAILLVAGFVTDPLSAQAPPIEGPIQGEGPGKGIEALKPGETQTEYLPDGSKIIRTMKDDGSIDERHVPPEDGMNPIHVPPHVREARMRGVHASAHFQPMTVLQPERLGPGQTGYMCVVVTMIGNAVVLPTARKNLTYKAVQAGMALQPFKLDPPRRGELKTKFRGKLVYDNTLIFKIPVTVPGNAKHGHVPFQGLLELEVHDGSTGSRIGTEKSTVEGRITVGRPIPTPNVTVPEVTPGGKVLTGTGGNTGTGTDPKKNGKAGTAAKPTTPGIGTRPNGGSGGSEKGDLKTEPEDEAVHTESEEPSAKSDGEGFNTTYLLAGGGVIVVGLLLLLLRRRK